MQIDSQVQCVDNEGCHKSKTQTLSLSSKMELKVLKKKNRTSQEYKALRCFITVLWRYEDK